MKTKFWKSRPETIDKIKAILDEYNSFQGRVRTFCTKVGAQQMYLKTKLDEIILVLAVQFAEPPAGWCAAPQQAGYYYPLPDSEHAAEFSQLRCYHLVRFSSLVGMQVVFEGETRSFGLMWDQDCFYMELPEDALGNGCDPITEEEYQAIVAKVQADAEPAVA